MAQAPCPIRRRSTGALLACAALLAACSTPPAPPAVDVAPAERYATDLDACRAQVGHAGVLQETLDFALQGALVAALLAWGANGDADTVRGWAWGGAALVGSSQGLQAIERRRQSVARCMLARGHGQATPWQPRPAAPDAGIAVMPAPQAQAETGADAWSAEQLARREACHPQPQARLAAKGPGFETYAVPCANSEALMIRCEFGHCRVLR